MSEPDVWQLIITRKVERTLRRLPKDLLQRLREAFDGLTLNPRPSGYKKLTGHDLYRIRVGDWRIIYAIKDDQLIILILAVAPQGRAYRNL